MTDLAGLHIGLVGPLPPPAGGMAMQTNQLAQLLRGARAVVTLVQTNAPYRPDWVARWPGLRALWRLLPYLSRLWRAAGRADVMHVMANSGWSWHLFAAPAIWVAWCRRVPVVVNYRGGEAGPFLHRSERLVRATMRRAAQLIVPSGFLQQIFAEHRMRSEIVPNVVDLECFHPADASAAPAAAAPHLLVARNLEALYDNATALRAFALVLQRFAQARLTIAGTGPQLAELQALAASLGVAAQVEFAGRLGRDEMANMLRHSHVALNPSRVDNMPNSVLEAMASGVPVVSTHVGGVPFMVQDGRTALLVPPAEPQAMAAAVLRLLEDPALAQRLVSAALLDVRSYTWDAVAPRLAEVYRASLAPRAA